MNTATNSRADRLRALWAEQANARAQAMVDYRSTVCGIYLEPVSLLSMSRLRAFENAFVTGAPCDFEAITNFVWVHHPRFSQFSRKMKADVTRHCWRALHPRWPTLNALVRLYSFSKRFRWMRRFAVPTAVERHGEAIAEIRRLLEEAWQDFPVPEAGGEPIPYAFEAYVLNLFRRELRMDFNEVRRMPLRRVVQHLRELIHHRSPKSLALVTRAESAIWEEHLDSPRNPTS